MKTLELKLVRLMMGGVFVVGIAVGVSLGLRVLA